MCILKMETPYRPETNPFKIRYTEEEKNASYSKAKKLLELKQAEIETKQSEFLPLINSINAVKSQIAILESNLDNAPAKIVSGELNTETFLKIKAELKILKESLQSFNEARETQNQSLHPLYDTEHRLMQVLKQHKDRVMSELPKRLLTELDPSHKDAFKNILKSFLTNNRNILTGYNQSPGSVFYAKLGELIVKGIGLPSVTESSQFSAEMALKILTESEA